MEIYRLGPVGILFSESEGRPSMTLIPEGMEEQVVTEKAASLNGMAQLHARGDRHEIPYARGMTMLRSDTGASMRLHSREAVENGVKTVLKGAHGLAWEQEITGCGRAVICHTRIINEGDAPVTIDQASTFCLSGLTPFEKGLTPDCLLLHRFTSFWSTEGRMLTNTLEELNMEMPWSRWTPRTVRIGQESTLPVNKWFPTMAIEDTRRNVTWAASIGWAGSWSMELFRQREDLALCGGLTSYEEGQFRKTLQPGEVLELPEAILTAVCGGVDEACEALLDVQLSRLPLIAEPENTLNPMYNEYCETWNHPTLETVRAQIKAIKDLGLSYLVIDAGWHGEEGDEFFVSLGDWQERFSKFPNGVKQAADEIRAAGMIPGIWFEAEVAYKDSRVFREHPEMFVTDNGKPIIETDRAFYNLDREDAQAHLKERIIDFLNKNGFGYIKIDYNNTYGMGFDGYESIGEAQRRSVLGTYRFFEAMRENVPGLVIENCASGGHRLELSMLSRTDMSSFSDAHECIDIPLIAADLSRLLLPRTSQIWAVLRPEDSIRRVIWSLTATLLGRMCISGKVAKLNEQQMEAVRRGVAFYRLAAPVIAKGSTRVHRKDITHYDHAHGWQAVVRTGEDKILLVTHAFNDNGGEYTPDLCLDGYAVEASFMDDDCSVSMKNGRITFKAGGPYCGFGVLLKKS